MNERAPETAVFDARRLMLVQAGIVVCCTAAFFGFGGPGRALAALVVVTAWMLHLGCDPFGCHR